MQFTLSSKRRKLSGNGSFAVSEDVEVAAEATPEQKAQSLALKNQGNEQAEAGSFAKALVLWERALGLTPTGRDGAVLHELMAQGFLQLGDGWRAVEAAERSVQLDGAWVEGLLTCGRANMLLGRPAESIAVLERAAAAARAAPESAQAAEPAPGAAPNAPNDELLKEIEAELVDARVALAREGEKKRAAEAAAAEVAVASRRHALRTGADHLEASQRSQGGGGGGDGAQRGPVERMQSKLFASADCFRSFFKEDEAGAPGSSGACDRPAVAGERRASAVPAARGLDRGRSGGHGGDNDDQSEGADGDQGDDDDERETDNDVAQRRADTTRDVARILMAGPPVETRKGLWGSLTG